MVATIADLAVVISADITLLESGLNKANKGITGFGQDAGKSLMVMGASITALTSPLVAFGTTGINVAADFEASMAEVSARTGIVGDDLQAVSDFALKMGADTSFSAQQAADGFLQLLSSGQTAEQAIATLPAILDAAAASGEDLGATADTVTDIMAAFGITVGTQVPDNFSDLQKQMGITDKVFTMFGSNSESAATRLTPLADALGVTTDQLYDMWNASKPLTPEIGMLASKLGVTQEMWDAYGVSVSNITPEIKQLIDATGLSGSRLSEMFSPMESAADVVDILAKAAGASSASMADLGEGFGNVGGVAKQFGLDVETTAATLALFSENGIKGAEAGTTLKSMLLNMSATTDPVQGAWKELGLSMYDAQGNMRDFETIIGDLDGALDKLPVERQNELMRTLAGSYGITGLVALRGATSIGDMEAAMDGAAGASTVAGARMATFKGKVDSLKGSVETLQIRAFMPLIQESLTPLVGVATDVVNSIIDFTVANPELTSTLIDMGIAAVSIGPVIAAIGAVLFALSSPLIAAGVGITALIVGAVGLKSAFDNFIGSGTTTQLVDGMMQVSTPADRLREAFSGLGADISASLSELGNIQIGSKTVNEWTLKITTALEDAVGGIVIGDTTLGALAEGISTKLGAALGGISIDASSLVSLPGDLIKAVQFAMAYGADFNSIASLVGARISRALGEIKIDLSSMASLANDISVSLRMALQNVGVGDVFSGLQIDTSGLANIPNQIGDAISGDFTSGINIDTAPVADWMNQNSQSILDAIVAVAGVIFGGPIGMAIGAAKLVSQAINSDFLGIGTFLDTSGISAAVTSAFTSVKATIDGIIASIFGGGGGGQTSVSGADFFDMTSMIMPEGQADTSGLGKIADDISMAINVIKDVASNIGGDVIKGLKDFGDGVGAFLQGVLSADTSGLYDFIRPFLGVVSGLVIGGISLAGAGIGAILSDIGAALGPFGEGLGKLVTAVSTLGRGDVGGTLKLVGDAVTKFGEAITSSPLGPIIAYAGVVLGISAASSLAATATGALATAFGIISSPVVLTAVGIGLLAAGFAALKQGIEDGTISKQMGAIAGVVALVAPPLGLIAASILGISTPIIVVVGGLALMAAGFMLLKDSIENGAIGDGLKAWGEAIGNAWLIAQLAFDGIKTGLYRFSLDIQLQLQTWIGDIRRLALNATGIDIAPNFDVDANLVRSKIATTEIGDVVYQQVRDQIASGEPLDLGQMQMFTVKVGDDFVNIPSTLGDALLNPAIIADMGLRGKLMVEDALKTAFTVADQQTIDLLTPVAVQMGIDITGLEASVKAQIAGGSYDTTVTANIAVNSIISFMQNVPNLISQGVTAAGGVLNDLAAAVAPPGEVPALASGTPMIYGEGLIYAHAGEAVLTADQNAAYRAMMKAASVSSPAPGSSSSGGRSNGGNTYQVSSYGESARELMERIRREAELSGM